MTDRDEAEVIEVLAVGMGTSTIRWALDALAAAGFTVTKAVTVTTNPHAGRCTHDLSSRPSWMSPDQYDPCRCRRVAGHSGDHWCPHKATPEPSDVYRRIEGGNERCDCEGRAYGPCVHEGDTDG